MAKSKAKFNWYEYLKGVFISVLKQQATKLLLAKLISIALIPVSWQAWLARFIVDFLFDKIVIPLLRELELEGKYRIDIINGRKRIKLLNEAIANNEENTVNDYIDSL